MRGIIVGVQEDGGQKVYRIVLYNRANGETQYNKQVVPEHILISTLQAGKIELDNASVVNGKIKGTTGDLNRFKADGFHPTVILSEMVADGVTIGYRIATYDGKVTATRIKDVLAYCARVSGKGAPIQNAMYVAESENTGKAHLRAYPGQSFYKEIIERKKADNSKPAKINKQENEKQVSKLEELFNREQIKQLRLGKDNGVDIRVFGNNKLSAEQMKELRLALESGINAKVFADPAYSVDAMKALRINAKYGVDVTYFVNPKYNAEQIYELSTGYLSGIDLTKFADTDMSANDMAKKRVYLESQLWNEIEAKQI